MQFIRACCAALWSNRLVPATKTPQIAAPSTSSIQRPRPSPPRLLHPLPSSAYLPCRSGTTSLPAQPKGASACQGLPPRSEMPTNRVWSRGGRGTAGLTAATGGAEEGLRAAAPPWLRAGDSSSFAKTSSSVSLSSARGTRRDKLRGLWNAIGSGRSSLVKIYCTSWANLTTHAESLVYVCLWRQTWPSLASVHLLYFC
jgi:hypothetical protein